MKLSNIKHVGRYVNTETKQVMNVKQGRNMPMGTDHLFYLYRNKRVFVSQADFYGGKFQQIQQP